MRLSRTLFRFGASTAGLALLVGGACSGDQQGPGGETGSILPEDVRAIAFISRAPRNSNGNVFDYDSYVPGGAIMKLEPPSPNGKLTNLTALAAQKANAAGAGAQVDFSQADIMSWDLSFDAQQIAFSARLTADDHYQLFTMNLDGSNLTQVTAGDHDYVFPTFVPGQKLLFTTNQSVEEGSPQFQDEYERATTSQVGTINLDGTNMVLGARNVSHRVAPSMLSDGRVIYTEWRHLGMVNDGHLRMMNADMTGMKEAFGSELQPDSQGQTNSYLRARYVDTYTTPDGKSADRVVAIGTSRDRTLQAGKLLLISLAESEATSSAIDLTPTVPGGRTPSSDGVGRFYDAEPIGTPAGNTFLVSWADGPVESEVLEMAKLDANFGLYVFDAVTGVKHPLYDNPKTWEIQARAIKARREPPVTASPIQGESFVVGAINVYNSSLDDVMHSLVPPTATTDGNAVKVRLIEGFSGEEGVRMFGSTEFDGASLYGEVDVQRDGSFQAKVPANVPVHMQVIDKFAISVANEDIWVSGRPGEQRTCGGCHENRSATMPVMPGQTMAQVLGPMNLDVPRAMRTSTDYSYGKVRGVPWDKAIQPMLTAKCVSCHDGDATKVDASGVPMNRQFTVMDITTGTMQTFTFDLRGDPLPVTVGEKMSGGYSASYISIFGLGEMLGEDNVMITPPMPGDFKNGLAADAAHSPVIMKVNPIQQFPTPNPSVHRYDTKPHPTTGNVPLTPGEYYLLGLSIDMGGQFFSRENKDEAVY
jgi:hydrazine synthase alpha subunit-like protein